MILRELVTKIGFDVDDKALKNLDKNISTVRNTILAVGAAGVAVAGSLFGLVKTTADAGDEVAKTASRIGVGTDFLQAYRYAAEQAGVSSSNLESSLSAFNRRMGEAARGGGPALATLQQLGISVRKANGELKSNEQLLAEVSDKLKNVKDASLKSAFLDSMFSQTGRQMVDFIGQGSEEIEKTMKKAKDLGHVMSKETLKDSERFGDAVTDLKKVLTGLRQDAVAKLIPVFADLVEGVWKFILANRELILQRIHAFIDGLIRGLKSLYSVLTSAISMFIRVSEYVGGVENALKLLLGAFVAIKALNFVRALVGIATALSIMGKAALVANLAVFGIPLAIAAVVAAVLWFAKEVYEAVTGTELGMEKLKEVISGVAEALAPVFQWIFGQVLEIVQGFIDLGKILSKAWDDAVQYVADLWKYLFGTGSEESSQFVKDLLGELATLKDYISGVLTGAFTSLLETAMGVFSKIGKGISGAMSSAKSFASRAYEGAKSFAGFDREEAAVVAGNIQESLQLPNGGLDRDIIRGSSESKGISNHSNVNVKSDIIVNVPPGTNAQQTQFLRDAARASFREEYEKELQSVLYANPVRE